PNSGYWSATVSADVSGTGPIEASTGPFQVWPQPQLPAPGDRALLSHNLTVSSKNVPPSAIDSRAQDGKPIPDRFLHRWTVADAMAAHRPIVLVFASPTYCTSQFCGPTVSEVARLYKTYSGKAAFIDVQIYRRHSS